MWTKSTNGSCPKFIVNNKKVSNKNSDSLSLYHPMAMDIKQIPHSLHSFSLWMLTPTICSYSFWHSSGGVHTDDSGDPGAGRVVFRCKMDCGARKGTHWNTGKWEVCWENLQFIWYFWKDLVKIEPSTFTYNKDSTSRNQWVVKTDCENT